MASSYIFYFNMKMWQVILQKMFVITHFGSKGIFISGHTDLEK